MNILLSKVREEWRKTSFLSKVSLIFVALGVVDILVTSFVEAPFVFSIIIPALTFATFWGFGVVWGGIFIRTTRRPWDIWDILTTALVVFFCGAGGWIFLTSALSSILIPVTEMAVVETANLAALATGVAIIVCALIPWKVTLKR